MWTPAKYLTAFMLVVGLSFSSAADTLESARAKLLSGDYDTAINMGQTMGGAAGLSLAAETISAKVMLGYTDDPKDAAKMARKLAEKALKLDGTSREAHVQYALAYGFETQSSSPFRAWRKNLPEKTLGAIEDLREKFPDDARGDALLGAWHLGIVRKAGEKRGRKMFGAEEAQGILHYEAALEKSPSDIVILSNFSAVLLTIDAARHSEKAVSLLERIYEAEPGNAVEQDVKTRMERFRDHKENPKKLMALAEELLDGAAVTQE